LKLVGFKGFNRRKAIIHQKSVLTALKATAAHPQDHQIRLALEQALGLRTKPARSR